MKVDEILGKSQWWRADDFKAGDKLKVLNEGRIDSETFKPRSYLILSAEYMRTGEVKDLRLGPRNISRIAEAFGKDTSGWVGKYLEVVSIENYPGLSAKGILLRGCATSGEAVQPGKPAPKAEGLSPQTVDTIRKSADVVDMGIPLNESDFSILPAGVRAELLKNEFVEKRVEGDSTLYFFTEKARTFLKGEAHG